MSKIAIETELLSTLQATLEATRIELAKVQQQAKGNEPFTIEEAAKYLKVSRSTLYTYLQRNEITPSEYGSRVWIIRTELDRFIERHRRKAFA